jgi:hypothetical protein
VVLVPFGTGHRSRTIAVAVVAVGTALCAHPGGASAHGSVRLVVSNRRLRFLGQRLDAIGTARVVEVFNPGPGSFRPRVRVHDHAFRLAPAQTTCVQAPILRRGDECAMAVRFAPLTLGRKVGALVLSTRAGVVLARIRLEGVALVSQQPHVVGLVVRPSVVGFGAHAVGTRSAPRTVTIMNPLAIPVAIARLRLAGAAPGNFRLGRQSCTGTLRPGSMCAARVRFTPRFVAIRTATLVIPAQVAGGPFSVALTGRGASRIPSLRNAPLTLAALDRPCFYAHASPGHWPVAPASRPHAIRGGFNDPRGRDQAHFGTDVTAHDQAPALAVRAGTIVGIASVGNPTDEHFELLSSDGVSRYFYYHVHPAVGDGTPVAGGWALGRIEAGFNHVHLSEIVGGCGLVDPRRPTGILRDRANTEAPTIGPLAAYRATAAAFQPFRLDRRPGPDPAIGVPLDALHGVVDMRADVSDLPRHATVRWPQQPLMAAGVRSFLAPVGRPGRHFGGVIQAYDGSRFIDVTRVYRVFAHGTFRINSCFSTKRRTCETVLRLHAAGAGFDTRAFQNGEYLYCVSAITIRGRIGRRCTPVTIRN